MTPPENEKIKKEKNGKMVIMTFFLEKTTYYYHVRISLKNKV